MSGFRFKNMDSATIGILLIVGLIALVVLYIFSVLVGFVIFGGMIVYLLYYRSVAARKRNDGSHN